MNKKPLLVDIEKLARWWNILNCWDWPIDMPGKPVSFDRMIKYLPKAERTTKLTKLCIISPITSLIESIIGMKECLQYHHLNNLDRTNKGFELWWLKHRMKLLCRRLYYHFRSGIIEIKRWLNIFSEFWVNWVESVKEYNQLTEQIEAIYKATEEDK